MLGLADVTEFKNWETSIGFTSCSTYKQEVINENYSNYLSLGENAPEKEYNKYVMPNMGLITNKDGEYQVGDSIYFFVENIIYGLPYTGEDSFNEYKSQILNTSLKSDNQNLSTFEIKIDTLQPKANNLKTTGLDACYQDEWNSGGHTFKFVFESYSAYTPGDTKTTIYVQIKLEYWQEKTFNSDWAQAGESVFKVISNLSINDIDGNSQLADPWDKSIDSYSSENLMVQSNSTYFGSNKYVIIGGTLWAYTTSFENNNSYSITKNCLWDDYIE